MSRRGKVLAAWLFGGFVAAFAILPLCDIHFDCGCLQGVDHCDIREAGPPDCPWCDRPAIFVVSALFSYGLALVGAFRLPERTPLTLVAVTSLVLVLVGILLAGIATSLVIGRPVLGGL